MSTETLLNRISALCLVGGGIFFVYEGAVLVDLHRKNPERIPKKIAVAGALTIFLGVLSLGFAALHYFFDGGDDGIASMQASRPAVVNSANTKNALRNANAVKNTIVSNSGSNANKNAALALANTMNNTRLGPTNTSRMNTSMPRY